MHTVIDMKLEEDGSYSFRVGERNVAAGITDMFATRVLSAIRQAYAQGRKDARAETAAALRGLMAG
jgi:hypothetical protein